MDRIIIFISAIFLLISCSFRIEGDSQKEVSRNNTVSNNKEVSIANEISGNKENVFDYYDYNVDRNGDEYLPVLTGGSKNMGLNIILVSLYTDFKNFERFILSKSGKILSKNERGWYRVELSEDLFEFIEPSCVTDSYERQTDYFGINGDYSTSYHREVLYPTEPCETYYKRKNEEKKSGVKSGSLSDSNMTQGGEDQTGLPLAVSVKSTENYNGMKVAERQILLISKDEVSFENMKRAIEGQGWKLLANNFNLYQVDVSNQGESLDEILKMTQSMPEVETASVNTVGSSY